MSWTNETFSPIICHGQPYTRTPMRMHARTHEHTNTHTHTCTQVGVPASWEEQKTLSHTNPDLFRIGRTAPKNTGPDNLKGPWLEAMAHLLSASMVTMVPRCSGQSWRRYSSTWPTAPSANMAAPTGVNWKVAKTAWESRVNLWSISIPPL